jgi:hypothetical protein
MPCSAPVSPPAGEPARGTDARKNQRIQTLNTGAMIDFIPVLE